MANFTRRNPDPLQSVSFEPDMSTRNNWLNHEIILSEEEISDVSMASDNDNPATPNGTAFLLRFRLEACFTRNMSQKLRRRSNVQPMLP